MKHKVLQPFRNNSDYQCYLAGVTACAKVFGFKVDSMAWGGGLPIDLTLWKPEDKPEPVVVKEVKAPVVKKKKSTKKKKHATSDSRT